MPIYNAIESTSLWSTRFSLQDSLVVEVPSAFLTDTAYVGRMAGRVDERAFDVYMFLCKSISGVETPWYGVSSKSVMRDAKAEISLDYDTLARYLGIDTMQPVDYRRQINKTLVKLHDDYHLAHVMQHWGKNAEVTLTSLTKGTVAVPAEYWDYGISNRSPPTGTRDFLRRRVIASVNVYKCLQLVAKVCSPQYLQRILQGRPLPQLLR
jgi:hypothetical protein